MELIAKVYDLTDISQYRNFLYSEIDKKTGELILEGFVYSSNTFSLSSNAQNNLLGTFSAKDSLTYPFSWNNKDDSATYEIADAVEMGTFFMTALGTKKAHQDSGTVLKTSVRDAVSIAALDLITDNR